ncbi:DNA-directed RNA polymerase subunit omega [Collinsella tanakaei]|uniref:DNA-directed RNA polymerase subunit omega n=1 Tax=Collinsella tanakaei TaxID=626935 RepID=UPI000D7B4373|nr:DNA-directed RNA polymerase subunit omega [Collinsella tanakaei]PWM13564.1 MAG: DNA-directed RNA polymerase subunit omega [Collinsella tanakaei]
MSVIKPKIDDLLDKTDNNRFLLASVASKRACDINSMLREQHSRVLAVQDIDDITIAMSGKDTISMAMEEIVDGDISFEHDKYEAALGHKAAEE